MDLSIRHPNPFVSRHIGPDEAQIREMLKAVGAESLEELSRRTVPEYIRLKAPLDLPAVEDEHAFLAQARALASGEQGLPVPYRHGLLRHGGARRHPAQHAGEPGLVHPVHPLPGRNRPGPPRSPAQLPDHGDGSHGPGNRQRLPARRGHRRRRGHAHVPRPGRERRTPTSSSPPSAAIPRPWTCCAPGPSRWASSCASPARRSTAGGKDVFGVLVQYPDTRGDIADSADLKALCDKAHAAGAKVAVAADLLALTLLTPPGEFGADVVRGLGPALRRAHGLRRPACRLLRHPRRLQAPDARPHHRRLHRRPRQPRLPHGPADPRAAHPPRKGHQQHLHRPGAAGGDGGLVRRLPRAPAASRPSPPACTPWPAPWRRASPPWALKQANAAYFDTLRIPLPDAAAQAKVRAEALAAGRNLRYRRGRLRGHQPGRDLRPRRRGRHRRHLRRRPGQDPGPRPAGRRRLGQGPAAWTGPRPWSARAASSRIPSSTPTTAKPRCCATSSRWRTRTWPSTPP